MVLAMMDVNFSAWFDVNLSWFEWPGLDYTVSVYLHKYRATLMLYIVDGYNLIGQMTAIDLAEPNKEEKLYHFIRKRTEDKNDRFMIIFDGKNINFPYGSCDDKTPISITFTDTTVSADQHIKQLLLNYKRQSHVRLVTSDKDIVKAAKKLAIKSMSSKQFLYTYKDTVIDCDASSTPLSSDDVSYWADQFGETYD